MPSTLTSVSVVWLGLQLTALCLRYACKIYQLEIGWLSITVKTSALNRRIHSFGRLHQSNLRQWYLLGVFVAAMLGASSAIMLLREAFQAVRWADQASNGSGSEGSSWAISLAVPGLTVPWAHSAYLWTAIAISVGIHEAGHALSAATEGVGTHYVAGFAVLLLPGAMVGLDTETLAVLNPIRTLKIVCAGVWHNAVLCLVCWLAALLLPLLLMPAYSTGSGAVVRSLLPGGPLEHHLSRTDLVTRVNGCPVWGSTDWLQCLAHVPGIADQKSSSNAQFSSIMSASQLVQLMDRPLTSTGGYCVSHETDAHSAACNSNTDCGENELCFKEALKKPTESDLQSQKPHRNLQKASGTLFEHVKSIFPQQRLSHQGPVNETFGPRSRLLTENGEKDAGSCIRARTAVSSQPCSVPGQTGETSGGRCPSMSKCLKPVLPHNEDLLKICYTKAESRRRRSRKLGFDDTIQSRNMLGLDGQDKGRTISDSQAQDDLNQRRRIDLSCPDFLVFIGPRGSLLQAVEMGDHLPVFRWLPMSLPQVVKQSLEYTFAVSAALALINMAPVYGLDGEAALKAVLDLSSSRYYSNQLGGRGHLLWGVGHKVVGRVITFIGTSIFGLLLLLNVLRLTGYDAALLRLLAALRHLLTFSVRWG